MPRVTNRQFLDRHDLLRQVWLQASVRFGNLTTNEQWDLHAYYLPAKNLTDAELLEHRDHVTKERPSLPNKAGRALAALTSGQARGVTYGPVITKGKRKGSRIRVRAVARPEPDVKKLAKALLMMAQEQIRNDERRTS